MWQRLDSNAKSLLNKDSQSDEFFEPFFTTGLEVSYKPFPDAQEYRKYLSLYDGLTLMIRSSIFHVAEARDKSFATVNSSSVDF